MVWIAAAVACACAAPAASPGVSPASVTAPPPGTSGPAAGSPAAPDRPSLERADRSRGSDAGVEAPPDEKPEPTAIAPDSALDDLRLIATLSVRSTAVLVDATGRGWIVHAGDRVGKQERTPQGCVRRWRVAKVARAKLVLVANGGACPAARRQLLFRSRAGGP